MQPRHRQASTVARPVAPKGKRSSKRPEETPVDFILKDRPAKSVTVAGTFNDWDASRTPLAEESKNCWKATVWLPTGRYEYRFVVDGQWINDPNARESVGNTFGSTNSVLVV